MILIGNIGFLGATLSFLAGMMYMGNPQKAVRGNTLLIGGMVLAIISTILLQVETDVTFPFLNATVILGLLVTGTLIGRKVSFGFQLTKMPELVSLFNGFGGLAAALIAMVGLILATTETSGSSQSILLISIFLGFTTFSASLVAFYKLGGRFRKPISHHRAYSMLSILFVIILILNIVIFPSVTFYLLAMILLVTFSLFHGVFFASGIGGGDMPILISFLNGLTGLLTVISGIYFESTIMILSGVFVGATGVILTVQMCKAMNTTLTKVFLSATVLTDNSEEAESYNDLQVTSPTRVAADLTLVSRVVIVPGFGLAVAKAQKLCRELKDELESLGIELKFVIHPVAGRMPGHMNVLLAEAGIEYGDILDLDKGNEYLNETDMCLVIGANDVVNTSAQNDPNSSIHGMPIVQTYRSKKVVIIKRGLSPGYAGIKNPLFEYDNSELLFTDAKEGLEKILSELKMK